MGAIAEKVAEKYDISREAQDEFGLRSQQRVHEATETGRFRDEPVPIKTDDGTLATDESIWPDADIETLSQLPTVSKEDGTVTPGNADGAAGLLLTSRSFADDHGLDVLAEVGTNHVAGVDPTEMDIGPIPAIEGLLDHAGCDIDDYDLFEINEVFASQCLYSANQLEIPMDRLNINGGAITIGHPLGCSGARLPVTLIHEM